MSEKSITISARGAIIGYTVLREDPFFPIVRLIVVTPQNSFELYYIYECIKDFKFDNSSSAQGQLTVPDISSYETLIPSEYLLKNYSVMTSKIYSQIKTNKIQSKALVTLQSVLLSKMSKVEKATSNKKVLCN
ncbi:restriction endonuclease subunit S [Leeuwenhoekiella marinoflava]|uniref:restriction endonuclease subunit S n=1 Tax=Leeuwenhoekiella marinoflava TaxID=988 RepID=UPI0009F9CF0A|nr:restriction endonuclease subunit S [Leeuwenhoekiella marinoflava]